jgi:hypothetical protein
MEQTILNILRTETRTLDELLARGAELARVIFEAEGELCPMMLGVTANGETELVLPDAEMATREDFERLGWERCLIISPVWPFPQRAPVREAVWLFAEDRSQSQVAHLPIVRTDGGKPMLGLPLQSPPTSG